MNPCRDFILSLMMQYILFTDFHQKPLFLFTKQDIKMLPAVLLFGISGGEILVLLLLVLLLFGPKKIPEIARMVGRGMSEVKKVQREINSEINRYSSEIDRETKKMDDQIKGRDPQPEAYKPSGAMDGKDAPSAPSSGQTDSGSSPGEDNPSEEASASDSSSPAAPKKYPPIRDEDLPYPDLKDH